MTPAPPSVGQIVLYRDNHYTYPAIIVATQAQTPGIKLDSDQHVDLGVFAADYGWERNVAPGSEYQDGTYFYPVTG
jgi:hypothetical protein